MKRIVALFLAVIAVLTFTSCEKKDTDGKKLSASELGYGEIITPETLTYYANTNEEYLNTSDGVKGIVIELPGLGGSSCLGGSINMGSYGSDFAIRCADNGIVVAYIFPGPWSWGSLGAVRMTDGVVAAIAKKYSLPESFPLVVSGGSMGGLGALNFAADTSYRNNLAGVVSACPCTDVLACFECEATFPRTYVSAVAAYDMPLKEALMAISPAHRIDDMPDVPYFICSDGADEIFPEEQCDKYVETLKNKGLDVTYYQQPGLAHGAFAPDVRVELRDFIVEKCLNGGNEKDNSDFLPDDALVIESVTLINDTQLAIKFSEPVNFSTVFFSGIRLTYKDGVGVTSKPINGVNQTLQFEGTLDYDLEDVEMRTLIWTMKPKNFANYSSIRQILNKEGVLEGNTAPVRFCFEEVHNRDGAKVNDEMGYIYNIVSMFDPEKNLAATQRCGKNNWEGAYADITVD